MAEVWIPGLLRGLCRGSDTVQAAGLTLGEVIDALEAVCPGIRARLVKDRDIADGLAVVVDGEIKRRGLNQPIKPDSEIVFLPAVEGGQGPTT